jgi:hypothetical protein
MPMKLLLLAACCLPVLAGCQKKSSSQQGVKNPISVAVSPQIEEASGIADSRTHPGALWVIEDSGNPPQLILLGHDGKVQQKFLLPNATNRDWEDVVLSDGYIYIGDIGDNNQKYSAYKIYKVPEPSANATEITSYETIQFAYPDGPHDAEGFLVEPQSGDIYLITKRDATAQVYKLKAPHSTTTINTAEKVGQLQFTGVVSAALAPDGSKLLVKTYTALYQFSRQHNESPGATLRHTPQKVAYEAEPQGEAVCFKLDGTGYFTLSEQLMGSEVQLHFYKKQ